MEVSMKNCKKLLGVLWFAASGVLFFTLLLQTILGHYGEKASEAWGWLLPSIMPTLLLIIGVLVMDALGKGVKTGKVSGFIFGLSFALSALYLLSVASMIFLQPFAPSPPLELMKQSNLWMGPFQGLVSASLGAFFVKREQYEC